VTRRAIAIKAAIVVALAACTTISLRTADAPATSCDLARLTGILTNNRPNGLALREPDGTGVNVLWPFGYSSRGFVGSMELIDPTGRSIAREGDTVQMAGGTNLDGVFVACSGTIEKAAPPG
jgi:hypothetical protein